MKRFALLITAASLLAVATFAKEGGNPEQPHRSFVSQKTLDSLKLSPEQSAKASELKAEFAKKRTDWYAAHPNPSPEQYKTLHSIRVEYRGMLRELLTPEQRTAFDKELEAAKKRTEKSGKSDEDEEPTKK